MLSRDGSPDRLSACKRANEVSLGHARFHSLHPSANHATGFCAGLRPYRQAAHPSRRNAFIIFRARVWLGPFTASLTVTAVFAYRRYYLCTAPPGGTSTRWTRAL